MRTRTVQIKVNLTPEESADFDRARGHVRRSIAARLAVLGLPAPRPQHPNVIARSVELRRIGTNLNQIARRLNAEQVTRELAEAAAAAVVELRNSLKNGLA